MVAEGEVRGGLADGRGHLASPSGVMRWSVGDGAADDASYTPKMRLVEFEGQTFGLMKVPLPILKVQRILLLFFS